MGQASAETEYCWVDSEVWEWNKRILNRDSSLAENGDMPGSSYKHTLSLVLELQDENRNVVKKVSCALLLDATADMLTVTQQRQFQSDREIQAKIARTIAELKDQYSGYKKGSESE